MSTVRYLMALLILTASAGARAGDFPQTALLAMGYREVAVEDFGTSCSEARQQDEYGFLQVGADLTGDDLADEARFLVHDQRGEVQLVVVSMTDQLDTYVLGSVRRDLIERIGMRLIPAGTQTTICASEIREEGCNSEPRTLDRPMLSMFRFDGPSELWWFDGEEFQSSVSFDPALSILSPKAR